VKQLFLISALLFLLPQVSFGQQEDSLYKIYKNTSGDSLISEAFYVYVSHSADLHTDSLDLLCQEAKQRISPGPMAQGFLMEKYALALKTLKAHYLASKNFKEALKAYRSADSPEDEVRVLRELASLSKIMDVLEDTQNYCFEGLKIAEKMNDHELTTSFLRKIGVNYIKMQSFANAEKSLKRAIKISKKHSDTIGIIYGYMSLGNAYKAQDEFELARDSYVTSLELAEITNNKRGLAGNYNNMASNLNKQERYDEAITYYLKAILINKGLGNKLSESYNYNNLGNVYSSLGNYHLALKYQLMSYDLKVEMNDKEGLQTSYFNLAELYRDLGDYRKSTKFYDLYTENKQNSLLEQNLLNLNELAAKYEDEKKWSGLHRWIPCVNLIL
jgi:tetratricopeptide (TPR) repeat protein